MSLKPDSKDPTEPDTAWTRMKAGQDKVHSGSKIKGVVTLLNTNWSN